MNKSKFVCDLDDLTYKQQKGLTGIFIPVENQDWFPFLFDNSCVCVHLSNFKGYVMIVITDADDWIMSKDDFADLDEARYFYLRIPSVISIDWLIANKFR